MMIQAVEISGWNGTVDQNGALASQGTITTPTNIPSPSVTTTVSGDYIVSVGADDAFTNGTYTAGSGFTIPTNGQGTYGIMVQTHTQASAGAITPGTTYTNTSEFVTGTWALEP
jgi:hypothetical protein